MSEREKILKMVENKTITAQEALELINALDEEETVKPVKAKKKNKFFRVRILTDDDNTKVNVNIPLSIAKKVGKLQTFIPNDAIDEMSKQGINFDEIDIVELIEMFEQGESDENLVDIFTEDGTTVKVYVD